MVALVLSTMLEAERAAHTPAPTHRVLALSLRLVSDGTIMPVLNELRKHRVLQALAVAERVVASLRHDPVRKRPLEDFVVDTYLLPVL
jgi:hypothetical protein